MAGDPSREQSVAREEVMKCEREIQSIKAALRRLGDAGDEDVPNSLDIVMLKVEGLPETAKPTVHLQLSSPIEEGTLTQIFDPLNTDPAPEGSIVSFKGVETSTATLTVSAKDMDIPLGSSTPHDLAPICTIDAMEGKDEYVTEIPVAIVAESSGTTLATAESTEESKGDSVDATATAEPILPVCTVTLKITYKPSPKDQREELYEILNKTSQRKATALENLRKISMAMTRAGGDSPSQGSSSTTVTKPAVKPGFLNKKQKEPTRLEKLYERTIGPNSILRRGLGFIVVTRNYFIFFGAITAFHFKGQLLALPPPV